jgi:hypothetical protein
MASVLSRIAICVICLACASTASAHYLWLSIDKDSGDHGTMNLYFEEGPWPRDGQYLGPFMERGKAWLRLASEPKSSEIELAEQKNEKKNQRWLNSALQKGGPRAVESYGKWGVYRYGKTDILLHYYAKYIDVPTANHVAAVGTSDNLKLDVRPTWSDGELTLQVDWGGTPAVGRTIYVRGPAGFKQNLKTDSEGVAKLQPDKEGRYFMRTYVEEDRAGKDGGKEYQKIRHHSSLTINLPFGAD